MTAKSVTSPSSTQRPNRLPLIIGALIAAAIGVGAVLALTTGGSPETLANEVAASVTVTGALPELAAGEDPAIGALAPTMAGVDFDGAAATVPAVGRRAFVFLAHWCPHCQRELPKIIALQKAGRLEDVSLLAVATATGATQPNYPPSAWFAKEGWTGPVLVDTADSAAAQAFGLSGFPYTVVIDESGKVVDRFSGELPEDELVRRLTGTAAAG